MSEIQMDKPSLPSIQFLLQEAQGPIIPSPSNNNNNHSQPHHNRNHHHHHHPSDISTVSSSTKRHYGHRASRSVSSLPLDLQNLSLQAPEDNNRIQPNTEPVTHHQPYGGIPISATEKPPSWMLPNDRPPPPPPPTPPSSYPHSRKSNFISHSRSVSEFTLPPLSLSSHLPTPTRTHRRAVSANTVDFMLSPSPNSSMRAQSYSPQESPLYTTPTTTATNPHLLEQLTTTAPTTNSNETVLITNTTADASGRYVCPYCHKKFSRPSSLRIHTYSHTGEKPFVCTEPGCGRHFSVQSNMRRHLRVHRLGRSVNSISHTLGTTNEENETI